MLSASIEWIGVTGVVNVGVKDSTALMVVPFAPICSRVCQFS